jgi:cytochrome c peroxidase
LRSALVRRLFLIASLSGAFLSGLLAPSLGTAASASRSEIESAWLAFTATRGEASLIRGDVNHPSANEIFRIIPDVTAQSLDEEKLQLGLDLFREARLSRDGSVSCSTCHIVMMGGVDRRPLSFGIDGSEGTMNAPTIFNASLNFRQFWDGRALTLKEQALAPIENPAEFDHDRHIAVAVLKDIPEYVRAFDNVYPDGISVANLTDAIAYYETMNFTGLESPFLQQFQQGQQPLSSQALIGQQRFVEVGCASCHNGVNLGGSSFQQLGVADPWYDSSDPASEADDGLFARTGREQDRHVFKVPTLHNVAITGPWMHDGSVTSLQQAVDQMARHQSGRYLNDEDIDDIVAFLRSTGDSLAMVGDCAVSGNYAVTLDCEVSQKEVGADQDGEPSRAALPEPTVLDQQHQQQYNAALASVTAAPAQISMEMQRIRSGEVAHFDFLQYEHIEMMRHARALSQPPANISADQRQSMLARAKELQQSAQEYELIISDFLRAHAVADSARANYQDLLLGFSAGADEKLLSLLAQAQRNALMFYANPLSETQAAFVNSTRALLESKLNPRQLNELQIQLALLLENLEIDSSI